MFKHLFLLLSFAAFTSFSHVPAETEIKILSWNMANFGKSKSDSTIIFIAKNVKKFDLISIQEVVAGPGGAQAVARLVDRLNYSGHWDYAISDPTNSSSPQTCERYAFVWNTKKVKKIGNAWLEKTYDDEIDREPFFARFSFGTKTITVVDFHARPIDKQPETEIKYFKNYPRQFPDDALVFTCDFNLPSEHTVFNPLKKLGFLPALPGQKTSLKKKADNQGNYLYQEKDNIFYDSQKITVVSSGVLDFVPQCNNLEEANRVSDHLGIWVKIK
jgi:deoxyribonuclease-1-like protein